MREVVLDTETTGLSPTEGHRIIEIGCVEVMNRAPTGRTFHTYLNPERDIPEDAVRVHGLTEAFLAAHPLFAQVKAAFLTFIGDDPLVIHNAAFDLKFLNAELSAVGADSLPEERAVDTMLLARRRFPGAPASLNALCARFGIDSSARSFHSALLDATLLADVYLELTGGRQQGLALEAPSVRQIAAPQRHPRPARPHAPTAAELAAHAACLDKITDPIWRR